MGKGSGQCARPAFALNTAAASIDELKASLAGAPSSVDRAVILAQWNRDRLIPNEVLPDEEHYVQQMLAEAEQRIMLYAEDQTLSDSWCQDFLIVYATEHDSEYRALVERCASIEQEYEAVKAEQEQWRLAQEKGPNPFTVSVEYIEEQALLNRDEEFSQRLMSLESPMFHADRAHRRYLARVYGTAYENEYEAGDVDMTDAIAAHRQTLQPLVDAHAEETRATYGYLMRLTHQLNAERPQPTHDPNWQDQSIEQLEPLLDEKGRAVLYTESLLRDDALYLSRRPRYDVINGKTRYLSADDTQRHLTEYFKEQRLDNHVILPSFRDGVFTEHDMPTPEEWHDYFSSQPAFVAEYTQEQQAAIVAVVCAHAAYTDKTTPAQRFVERETVTWGDADVAVKDEEQLIAAMIDSGATVVDGAMDLPIYASRHEIKPGQRLRLQQSDGTVVEYAPHYSCGITSQPVKRIVATLDMTQPDTINRLQTSWEARYAVLHGAPQTTYFIRNGVVVDADEYGRELHHSQRYSLQGSQETLDINGITWKAATEEDLTHEGYIYSSSREVWMGPEHARVIQAARDISTSSPFKQMPPLTGEDPSDARAATFNIRTSVDDLPLPQSHREWLTAALANSTLPTTEVTRNRREHVEQEAPMSERGQLRVSGANGTAVHNALTSLDAVGLLHNRVPLGLMHVGGTESDVMPPGRLTPPRHEYAAGAKHLNIPDGYMVMHGMTGVHNDATAHERLTRLIDSGGILPITERSRRNMKMQTMSPLGDIASGIDRGVPCSMQQSASHGSQVYFAMKPEVLERRDMWFAPRDFGAGDSRYDEYTAYAKSIGQSSMTTSPSHAARQRHLNTGIENTDNEVYLQDGISLHEIDTIFINASQPDGYRQQLEMLVQAKNNGILPRSVRVQCASTRGRSQSFAQLFQPMTTLVGIRADQYKRR